MKIYVVRTRDTSFGPFGYTLYVGPSRAAANKLMLPCRYMEVWVDGKLTKTVNEPKEEVGYYGGTKSGCV